MNKTNEIKQILLGRIVKNEEGMLVSRPKGGYVQVNGLVDGYFSVLFFGVMSRTCVYKWAGTKGKERETITRYVQQVGKPLLLKEHPDAIAGFTGRMVLTPTVVVAEPGQNDNKKNLFSVTVYTGRSPFGIWRCFAMHRRIRHLMGDLCELQKEK